MKKRRNDSIFTKSYFISAASQGRLWLVNRCLEGKIPVDADNGKALLRAVSNGRSAVVSLLLEKKADATKLGLLSIACSKGYTRIAENLILYNANVDENNGQPLLKAIRNSHTSCVWMLLKHEANVSFNNHQPLVEACFLKLPLIVKLLLEYKADKNARNGECLIQACVNGDLSIAQVLINFDADVSVRNDEPLLASIKNNHVFITILLLENGADKDIIDNSVIDETTMVILDTFLKSTRIKRLLKAIKSSRQNLDFKWQEYCSLCSKRKDSIIVENLNNQAKLLDINNDDKNKRNLCYEFALYWERVEKNRKIFDSSYTDFSGTMINDISFWKIIEIENIPFNCFDLFKMVKNNILFNPYTKNHLPLDLIKKKQDFLYKILTQRAYKDFNLLEKVAENPVASDETILKIRLEKIWDLLTYPPDINIFIKANDEKIDILLNKLVFFCESSMIFDIVRNGTYNMIKNSVGIDKKRLFVNYLERIVSVNDEHKDTRLVALGIFFRRFSTLNSFIENTDLLMDPFFDFDSDDDVFGFLEYED